MTPREQAMAKLAVAMERHENETMGEDRRLAAGDCRELAGIALDALPPSLLLALAGWEENVRVAEAALSRAEAAVVSDAALEREPVLRDFLQREIGDARAALAHHRERTE